MYYHHWFIERFEKNCIYRHSCRLSDSASRGVVFRLRISPRIRIPNRNGSKFSVRNLCRTDFCKNPRKSAPLPCPFNVSLHFICWQCHILSALFSVKYMSLYCITDLRIAYLHLGYLLSVSVIAEFSILLAWFVCNSFWPKRKERIVMASCTS